MFVSIKMISGYTNQIQLTGTTHSVREHETDLMSHKSFLKSEQKRIARIFSSTLPRRRHTSFYSRTRNNLYVPRWRVIKNVVILKVVFCSTGRDSQVLINYHLSEDLLKRVLDVLLLDTEDRPPRCQRAFSCS